MSIVESTAVNLVDDPPQYAGRIHFGDWQVRVPCIVKDVSGTSATLHLFGAKQLPSLIWLSIHELGLHEECQLIAKTNRTAKVQFGKSIFHQTPSAIPADQKPDFSRSADLASLPKLWVVEDDEDDRFIIGDAFRDHGIQCDIEFFKDGIEFLEHIEALDFSDSSQLQKVLTLIDINMPRMDGLATLQKLRQFPNCAHLPVMMFSTSESDGDVRRAYELGIHAYLPKPSKHEDIENVVQFISQFWQVNIKLSNPSFSEPASA